MEKHIIQLYKEMETELSILQGQADSTLQQAKQSIAVIRKYIDQIKLWLGQNQFADTGEEILFFKKLLPDFYKHLIFYRRLYFLEMQISADNPDEKGDLFLRERKRLKQHFNQHREFYIYYRSGATFLDEKYFVRGNEELLPSLDDYSDMMDSRYCTPYCYLVARLLAGLMLAEYIDGLSAKTIPANKGSLSTETIPWSAPKVALVELVYAIHAQGAVNPSIDVKKIANAFSRLFNVKLDNIYKTYEEMRLRKKNRTPFLHALIESLDRKMDYDDEYSA